MESEGWPHCGTEGHYQGGRKVKICPGLSCAYFSDRYFDSLNRKYLPYCEKYKTFLGVCWENQVVFVAEKCTCTESDNQSLIEEYNFVCEEIKRRVLSGAQIPSKLIRHRERLEKMLQATNQ